MGAIGMFALIVVLGSSLIAHQVLPAQVTKGDFASRAPAWSPNGTHIAFESNDSGQWSIDLLNVDSGEITHLTSAVEDDRSPAWSPDGRRIAFVRTDGQGTDIYVVAVNTGVVRRLPAPGTEAFPSWSPDGRHIAYSRNVGDSWELVRIEVETLSRETLLSPAGRDVWPRWSPDGERIAFFSRRHEEGDQDDVYVLRISDGALSRLTTNPGHDFCPNWAPDGRGLVFVSVKGDGTRVLQLVDERGRRRGFLGADFYRVTEPTWSPDGRRIAYAARTNEDQPYQIFVERVDVDF